MNLINMKIVLLEILIFLSSFVEKSKSELLYEGSDSVLDLNANNFDEYVYNQNGITLVNFYLNWCPHCIRFSNIWKQLASDIKKWKSVVRIAAIDCAVDVNSELCREFGITLFPRIRLFGVNSRSDDFGINFEVRESVAEMKSEIIDYLLKFNEKFEQNLNIFPIPIETKNELLNALSLDFQKDNFIFIEKSPTHLIAQIILEFSSLKEYINFIRIVDKSGNLSKELFGYSLPLPSLIRVNEHQSFELLASAKSHNEELLRREFIFKIKEELNSQTMTLYESNENRVKKVNESVIQSTAKSVALSLTDLYNTFRYSLHKEVVRYKTLNSTQVEVLRNFISIVYKYLPFDNENVRRFFKRMKIWFSNKTKDIKSDNLLAAMKISDGYLPPIVQWTHCKGSGPHFRGYPCGLWILFHVLTAAEYSRNMTENSHEVLPLMREFIINFFSCDECAKHFEITSRNLNSYLLRPESSVLWLWRVHNQINHRTKGSPSEDPLFPKVQYPSQEMCGQCYKTNSQFDETYVLKFILETYSKEKLNKSSDYFAEQRILNKNSSHVLVESIHLIVILITILVCSEY